MTQQEQVVEEEITEETTEVTEVTEEVNQETVDLAKSMGWVEEDKYRGNKDNWVNADAFVERGMNDLPVLRERVRNQGKTIAELRRDIGDFKDHHENTRKVEYQRAMQEIQDKQRKTVEDGDTEEYERLENEKAAVARAHQPVAPQQQENPLYTEWKDKNADWFEKDQDMTDYANWRSDIIAKNKPHLIGKQEFLEEIEKDVKERFKDKFENANRGQPPMVESGGRAHRSTGSKTYANLPAEAKQACDRFVRQGLITKEQYVQDYEWEQTT